MDISYAYKVYIHKDSLKESLKYLLSKCDKDSTDFDFKDDTFFAVDYSTLGKVKVKTNLAEVDKLECTILVEKDDQVISYYLTALSEVFDPTSEEEGNYLNFYKEGKNKFCIGAIDLYINDYSDKIPDTIELAFYATSSAMSLLFASSQSVENYFKKIGHELKAHSIYLFMMDGGIKLMRHDNKECNYTIPVYWPAYDDFGVIPVISKILKGYVQ